MDHWPSIRRIGLLGALSCLTACATPEPIPADHFYRIAADLGEPVCCTDALPSLSISDFRADGIYADRPVVVVSASGTELTQRRYELWMDSPGRMLAQALAAYLDTARSGVEILPEAHAREAELRIAGRIDHFELLHAGAEGYRPRVSIDFVVSDRDGRVRWSQRFDETGVAMPVQEALAGRGFSQVTRAVFARFVEGLAASVAVSGD